MLINTACFLVKKRWDHICRSLVPPGALSSFTKVGVLPFIGTLSTRFAMRGACGPLRYRSKFSQQGSKARNFGGRARTRALGCKNFREGPTVRIVSKTGRVRGGGTQVATPPPTAAKKAWARAERIGDL